jgi:hypothetical protein
MSASVTTQSIVNELQGLIDEIKLDKKLDTEKRVRLITQCTGHQLRAGALNVQYMRSVSRLPENAQDTVLQLNSPAR